MANLEWLNLKVEVKINGEISLSWLFCGFIAFTLQVKPLYHLMRIVSYFIPVLFPMTSKLQKLWLPKRYYLIQLIKILRNKMWLWHQTNNNNELKDAKRYHRIKFSPDEVLVNLCCCWISSSLIDHVWRDAMGLSSFLHLKLHYLKTKSKEKQCLPCIRNAISIKGSWLVCTVFFTEAYFSLFP
jgi:hypothetical protein